MGYIMDIDEYGKASFIKHSHKSNKTLNKQKYKRLRKIKRKNKKLNYKH